MPLRKVSSDPASLCFFNDMAALKSSRATPRQPAECLSVSPTGTVNSPVIQANLQGFFLDKHRGQWVNTETVGPKAV
jgi:hypothetical protein